MCRPPDMTPAAADALVYEDTYEDTYSEADASSLQVLGKRNPSDEARLLEALRCSKHPRTTPGVSSAFDAAAVSFMARMNEDLQREQQQKSEQQHLQLLRSVKQRQQQQQQLLLAAQQNLMQRSQSKLVDSLAAHPLDTVMARPSWASLLKEEPEATPSSLWSTGSLSSESRLESLLQGAVSAHPLAAVDEPVEALAAAAQAAELAKACSGMNAATAAAILGLTGQGQEVGASQGPASEEDLKKARRMQSNRASAKRSRQRRVARLEELDKATTLLTQENAVLADKLEEASKQIEELRQTNSSLTDEVASLRKALGLEHSLSPCADKAEPVSRSEVVHSDVSSQKAEAFLRQESISSKQAAPKAEPETESELSLQHLEDSPLDLLQMDEGCSLDDLLDSDVLTQLLDTLQ